MLGIHVRVRTLQYSTQANKPLTISLSSLDAARSSFKANELLRKLNSKLQTSEFQILDHDENSAESLNSDRSLPMTEFPKKRIFAEVANDDKVASWRKGVTKWVRLGVHMMKSYRNGLQDTYRVAKSSRRLIKDKNLDTTASLATQMTKLIEFSEIRVRLQKDPMALPVTRRQFVEFYRRGQVWKIPSFFLIALLLEEFTAVLCYFFPKVAPHNCLTPGAFLKVTRSHANANDFTDPSKYKSPYGIAKASLFRILRTSPAIQTPRWRLKLYELTDNRRQPCETLMQIHQYLFVDDCLLLRSILSEKTASLTYRELVNCIWERQLYSKDEDLNKMVNDPTGKRILIWRLFMYWSFRFDDTVIVGGNELFSEKWGVNNISILNFTGLEGSQLLDSKSLSMLDKCLNSMS